MEKQEIKAPNKNSKAKDLPLLFKKHKKLISNYYEFRPFEEPILLLERRNGEVEFKEKATVGRYFFTHSDGQERYLIINGNQKNFKFGDKRIKGYYCHEDHPFPLPEEPLITTEQINLLIDKTLHDKKEWETKLAREKTKFVWAIGGVIAIIIGMAILYKILVPPAPIETIGTQLAQAVANNNTMIINESGVIIS